MPPENIRALYEDPIVNHPQFEVVLMSRDGKVCGTLKLLLKFTTGEPEMARVGGAVEERKETAPVKPATETKPVETALVKPTPEEVKPLEKQFTQPGKKSKEIEIADVPVEEDSGFLD